MDIENNSRMGNIYITVDTFIAVVFVQPSWFRVFNEIMQKSDVKMNDASCKRIYFHLNS